MRFWRLECDHYMRLIHISNPFIATFDVKDKVDFDDVPPLSELTICQWIILDSTFTEGTKSWLNWILASDLQIKLSSILSEKDNQILFRTRIQPDDRQDVEEQK